MAHDVIDPTEPRMSLLEALIKAGDADPAAQAAAEGKPPLTEAEAAALAAAERAAAEQAAVELASADDSGAARPPVEDMPQDEAQALADADPEGGLDNQAGTRASSSSNTVDGSVLASAMDDYMERSSARAADGAVLLTAYSFTDRSAGAADPLDSFGTEGRMSLFSGMFQDRMGDALKAELTVASALVDVQTQDDSASFGGSFDQAYRCNCPACGGSTAMGGAASSGGGGGDRAENGSGATTFAVGATGNQGIDGLLVGVGWAGGSITYSDPTSASQYQAGHPEAFSNFQHIDAQQIVAMHFALNTAVYTQPSGAAGFSVEGFTGLSITYNGSDGSGTIRLANTSNPGTAYAYYPNNGVAGGDAFFGGSGRTPTMGDYDWHTVLHELGHSLGLKHGQETSVFGAMPSNLDSMEFSVMTYRSYVGAPLSGYTNEQFGYAQTYMMYDIAALQHMYGADFSTNSGNTTYTWNPGNGNTVINGLTAISPGGNRIFLTIWDGGGTDTYDLSAYSSNLTVDLAPGGYSVFSTTQLADLNQFSAGFEARGNVFNALQYQGNAASLIENATGGSGNDSMSGNAANNLLDGNAGNDTLNGLTGADTLYGGDGNDLFIDSDAINFDSMDGGAGIDTADFSGNSFSDNRIIYDLASGLISVVNPAGNTQDIIGVENLITSNASETLIGGFESNLFIANGGDDSVVGGGGLDTLYGGDGNDTIEGGFSTDDVYGGAGDDLFVVLNGQFYDNSYGGSGIDTLDHSDSDYAGDTFDFAAGLITGTHINGTSAALSSIEVYFDGIGGNTIVSDGGSHTYYGGDGDDTMRATAGGETMYGGAGIDDLDLSIGNFIYTFDMTTGLATQYPAELFLGFENVTMGSANDTVTGSSAANRIDGGGGNDSLLGLSGIDTIYGGDGNDFINGGTFVDQVFGGLGDDTLAMTGGDFIDDVDGGAGIDTLDMSGYTFNFLTADLGAGTYTEGGGSGIRSITGVEVVIGTGNNDVITGGGAAESLYGGGGNDALSGASGVDVLDGGDGNDTLNGGLFKDTSYGGNGDDTFRITGVDIADDVYGGAGIDTLDLSGYTTFGFVVDLTAGSYDYQPGIGGPFVIQGVENVIGSNQNDSLTGDSATNTLDGGGGNDTIRGGSNTDQANGGSGDDLIIIAGGDGLDNADGGTGNDTLDYATAFGGDITFDLATGVFDFAGFLRTATGFENFIDSASNGSISGTGSANRLEGNAGNDSLGGLAGNDTLIGGDGNDTLQGGTGDDSLVGGLGDDEYVIDVATDTIVELAGQGIDLVRSSISYSLATTGNVLENLTLIGAAALSGYGNDLSNVLTGNGFDNFLNGQLGDDTLIAGGGNDTALGGDGNDSIVGDVGNDSLNGGAGIDSLYGGIGNDTLNGLSGDDVMDGGAGNDEYYVGQVGDTIIELAGGGTDLVRSSVDFSLAATGNVLENLTLSGAAINGTGNAAANVINGSGLDNFLDGLNGNDTILAGGGNDTVNGGNAHDSIVGDLGNDSLNGGFGNDSLYGGNGNDTLNGANGADSMVGGIGNDEYYVDSGADVIVELAGEGTDLVRSSVSFSLAATGNVLENLTLSSSTGLTGNGNDLDNVITGSGFANLLNGGLGNDTLLAGGGNDTVNGGNGNDSLVGDLGNDSLNGGAGLDTLVGGNNLDTLTGGADADVFVFADNFGVDRITDFAVALATEFIDLSAVTAIVDFADLQANHLTSNLGGDAVIFVGASTLTLTGVSAASLTASEFLF